MAGQTYSPYRKSGRGLPERPGRPMAAPVRPQLRRPGGVPRVASASPSLGGAPDQRALTPARLAPIDRGAGRLAGPAARRWILLGALGIMSSVLLTVALALLSSKGVASANVPPAETTRQNRVTMVREIGGVQRSPTPGTGTTASAPAAPGSVDPAPVAAAPAGPASPATAALRQLRRVGRAIVTPDGIRKLALGGALPFAEPGGPVTALSVPGAGDHTAGAVAFADETDDLEAVTLFFRAADVRHGGLLATFAGLGRSEAVVLASPVPATPTPVMKPVSATTPPAQQATAAPVTATSVPPTATAGPATATPVAATATSATATATPVAATATPAAATATSIPPTATSAAATATPVGATATLVVVTATPLPATQTPIVVTATPEPTRRATRTPTPEVVIVTATPWTSIIPNVTLPFQPPTIPQIAMPWQPTAAPAATSTPMIPATPAPTNTPIPTATLYVVPRAADAQAAPASAPAASAPRRSDPAPILAEAGTRTPATPTARPASRQAAPPEAADGQPAPGAQAPHGQAQPGAASAAAPDAAADAALLEKLAARAIVAVNAARAQAGALPLARNSALDTAATLHARYDVATGQTEGNFQTRGVPQFLGETPGARVARAAGGRSPAADRVGEVLALGEAEPERSVQGWIDSVFHRVLILDLAAQYGGFGQASGGRATTAVFDLGGRRDVANASGWFPASGALDVPTQCLCDDYAEATGKPGPFGYPVTLLLGQVRPLGLPTTARLLEGDENGPAVATELVDAFGNPTLVPRAPLKAKTRYVVEMAWANGPSVSWSFTTAGQ